MKCLVQDCPNDTKNVLKVCLEHEAQLWYLTHAAGQRSRDGEDEYCEDVLRGVEHNRKHGLKAYALRE